MEPLENFCYMNPSNSGLKWPSYVVRQEKMQSVTTPICTAAVKTSPISPKMVSEVFVHHTDLWRIFLACFSVWLIGWLVFKKFLHAGTEHSPLRLDLCSASLVGGATASRTGASLAQKTLPIVLLIKGSSQILRCALCREQCWACSICWGWQRAGIVICRLRCHPGDRWGLAEATSTCKLCHTNMGTISRLRSCASHSPSPKRS